MAIAIKIIVIEEIKNRSNVNCVLNYLQRYSQQVYKTRVCIKMNLSKQEARILVKFVIFSSAFFFCIFLLILLPVKTPYLYLLNKKYNNTKLFIHESPTCSFPVLNDVSI